MAPVDIDLWDLQGDQREAVPVVLGIALEDTDRRRLTSLLNGSGVVMFAPDLATAYAMLGRRPANGGEPAEVVPDGVPDQLVRAGALEVDRARCRVHWRDRPLAMNRRDRDLLACLAGEPIHVRTYQQLHSAAWEGSFLDPGPVHAAVKRLRRKLRDAGVPVRIEAVRGVGYELLAPD